MVAGRGRYFWSMFRNFPKNRALKAHWNRVSYWLILPLQNVILVLAYVPNVMSTLIQQVLGGMQPLIGRFCSPNQCDQRFLTFKNQDYYLQISDFLHRFQMRDVTFVNVIEDNKNTSYQTYFEESYDYLRSLEIFCLQKKTVNIRQIMEGKDGIFWPETNTVAVNRAVIPFLRKSTRKNSTVIFFGDSYLNMGDFIVRFMYTDDLPELNDRVLVFQDIKYSGGKGRKPNMNLLGKYQSQLKGLFVFHKRLLMLWNTALMPKNLTNMNEYHFFMLVKYCAYA